MNHKDNNKRGNNKRTPSFEKLSFIEKKILSEIISLFLDLNCEKSTGKVMKNGYGQLKKLKYSKIQLALAQKFKLNRWDTKRVLADFSDRNLIKLHGTRGITVSTSILDQFQKTSIKKGR